MAISRGGTFKTYPIGFFHIDTAEVRTEEGKLYLFVAIDRTSTFAYADLHDRANRHTATAFFKALLEALPYKVHTILADNGIQFCDLPRQRSGPTASGGSICSTSSARQRTAVGLWALPSGMRIRTGQSKSRPIKAAPIGS